MRVCQHSLSLGSLRSVPWKIIVNVACKRNGYDFGFIKNSLKFCREDGG